MFWGLIIAFIGAVSNLKTVATVIPIVNSLDPITYSLLQGLLPVIVLSIFLALLPMIIASFSKNIKGRKSLSHVENFACQW
jgi:hypothetical protein